MADRMKHWTKELREWIVALATAAAVVVAFVALRAADSANGRTLQVLNDDKTPWLSWQGASLRANTSPANLRYALCLDIQNSGSGPALDATLSVTNSLGHAGETKQLAFMPGVPRSILVWYVEKASDGQQLREWLGKAQASSDGWFAVRLEYRRMDGQQYTITDTGRFVNEGVVWSGVSFDRVSSGNYR